MPHPSRPRTDEMKKHPPWYARGPGFGKLPFWSQFRRFTNWDAYVAYVAWREHVDREAAVTTPGNPAPPTSGETV